VALELNLVCFLVILLFITEEGSWIAIKYFLVQRLASGVLLARGV
jgi:hypothetical protein